MRFLERVHIDPGRDRAVPDRERVGAASTSSASAEHLIATTQGPDYLIAVVTDAQAKGVKPERDPREAKESGPRAAVARPGQAIVDPDRLVDAAAPARARARDLTMPSSRPT
jgi:hypothetical protein